MKELLKVMMLMVIVVMVILMACFLVIGVVSFVSWTNWMDNWEDFITISNQAYRAWAVAYTLIVLFVRGMFWLEGEKL